MTDARRSEPTPGPWRINGRCDIREAATDQPVALVALVPGFEATARLIAAAPDMLAVLKIIDEDAVTGGLCQSIPSGVLRDLRSAIFKATGESQ